MSMTTDRAIEILQGQICQNLKLGGPDNLEVVEALEKAISVLNDYRWIPRAERAPTVNDQRHYAGVVMLDDVCGTRTWPVSSINCPPGGVKYWFPMPKLVDIDDPQLVEELRKRFFWVSDKEEWS